MKKVKPINVTDEGCAFAIVTRYEARAYLKGLTGGGGYYPATGVLEILSDISTPRRMERSATREPSSPALPADTATAPK